MELADWAENEVLVKRFLQEPGRHRPPGTTSQSSESRNTKQVLVTADVFTFFWSINPEERRGT